MIEWLVRMFNGILHEGRRSKELRSASTIPLCKGKGDRFNCTNYMSGENLCILIKHMHILVTVMMDQ